MRLNSQQKIFTAEEVCALLGINQEDLQLLARSRHIGHRVVDVADEDARWFDRSDLAVLAIFAAQMSRRGL